MVIWVVSLLGEKHIKGDEEALKKDYIPFNFIYVKMADLREIGAVSVAWLKPHIYISPRF